MPEQVVAKTTKTARVAKAQPDMLFRAAADQAPQVMWIVNTKGAVTYLNQSWYRLVGGAPPKWYGHEWGEVVVPEDVAEMRKRWKLASASGTIFEGTRRVKSIDGSLHVLAYKATPVHDQKGQVSCWVGMDADITQIVATEAALRFANQELEAFAYSVSHDLRSPLITVQGFATALRKHFDAAGNSQADHYLNRISESVDYMALLIDGLLVLSDVARSTLKMEEVDISRIALGVLQSHRLQQPGRNLVCEVQPGMTARADSRLAAVLLENLLGNALKFTSYVQQPHIEVRLASQTTREQVFLVRDNGGGFDMAHAGQLFAAFQRLHRSDEFPGTGIGLATVQRIVTRHGGRVWAESEPGKGASLFFSLPRR
jgi:PAS domain S-box-containing protein